MTVRASPASAHTPVQSPGGILFAPRLGKELCSPLLWPLGDTQAAGAVASGWRSGRPVWCWEVDWQPGPSSPSSRGRAGCVRGGGAGCTPRPPWPGELAPGVVSAALSRRCPLAARPPERSGNETGRARSGTVPLFHNVPAQDLAAGAACAISERSFVFFFKICLSGRRRGAFPPHDPGHGTRGCLFWGPLSSRSQLCFHKPVASWVVEAVRWGSSAFAWGAPGGP